MYAADALLIGLSAGQGPLGRWPADAVEEFSNQPEGWGTQLQLFVVPDEED